VNAINSAMAAGRPLLVTGEPGVGKSQLARAAAKSLGRAFYSITVDSRTEAHDLIWHFDAVARLRDAQVARAGELGAETSLNVEHYVKPRALWWGLSWKTANGRAPSEEPFQADGGCHKHGAVVLIDEIDKGEADVPNGLLDALGSGGFVPYGTNRRIEMASDTPPLIVITSNGERVLPDAFVRRCLCLKLHLPDKEHEVVEWLVQRATDHFGDRFGDNGFIIELAAKLTAEDRVEAERRHWRPLPGQAECLDLLKAVDELTTATGEAPRTIILKVAKFTLRKHPDNDQSRPYKAIANDAREGNRQPGDIAPSP
ncbi:MAG: MoxR family ATPase, partial [Pseudomonadota bacterium]